MPPRAPLAITGVSRLLFLLPFPYARPTLRRAVSDPGLGAEEVGAEEGDAAPPGQRPATIGAEENSPSGWTKKMTDWKSQIARGFTTTEFPRVDVDFIDYVDEVTGAPSGYTIYVMIKWFPDRGSAFRRLGEIHTTILRARSWNGADGSPMISKAEFLRALYEEGASEALQAIWSSLVHGLATRSEPSVRYVSRGIHVPLTIPPWPFSFNFGLTQDFENVFDVLRGFFAAWMSTRFGRMVYVLEARPYHVSWE